MHGTQAPTKMLIKLATLALLFVRGDGATIAEANVLSERADLLDRRLDRLGDVVAQLVEGLAARDAHPKANANVTMVAAADISEDSPTTVAALSMGAPSAVSTSGANSMAPPRADASSTYSQPSVLTVGSRETGSSSYTTATQIEESKPYPGVDYLGVGYDIFHGNPNGDGMYMLDPGFKQPVRVLVRLPSSSSEPMHTSLCPRVSLEPIAPPSAMHSPAGLRLELDDP